MTMTATMIGGDRLHLHHGPIDLIIKAEAKKQDCVRKAYSSATKKFESVLDELVAELPLLKTPISTVFNPPKGQVARRMYKSTWPYARRVFVTPMAAVAGAVADEILSCMLNDTTLTKAYVNNGGDISIYLGRGEKFTVDIKQLNNTGLGQIELFDSLEIGGIATSGKGGRSLSMGIADSVTVLAGNASDADVAATLIANHVDIPEHPGITRMPAEEIVDDSDLINQNVVIACENLDSHDVELALARGSQFAQELLNDGKIKSVAMFLQNSFRLLGPSFQHLTG
ncbi:MAG: UPF0280 family protein [Rhodobacteraceae bacterium]|nr:UPF0280 family protein [Paracoccaceae bacterium]